MGKPTLKDRIKDRLSDLFFWLFLKVNGMSKKQYYHQWVGFTEQEYKDYIENSNL